MRSDRATRQKIEGLQACVILYRQLSPTQGNHCPDPKKDPDAHAAKSPGNVCLALQKSGFSFDL